MTRRGPCAPFFLLVPSWALIPMVVLATAATVIASQAVIAGAISVARQPVQLSYLPRLRIVQTSVQTVGQIGAVALGMKTNAPSAMEALFRWQGRVR